MNLLELQRRMAADVTRPLTADFAMQTVTHDGESVAENAAEYVKPNLLLSSFDRLEIYNRQYWFRVIGAVSEDYPSLHALLGPKRFDSLVLAYLKDTPSTSYTLRDLSGKLPEWLVDHPDFAGAYADLATDIARLEWAYIEAFDAHVRPALTENDFSNLVPSSVLSLQPHVRLLALRYPVDEIVLTVRRHHPATDIASNAASERKASKRIPLPRVQRWPTYLVIHRFEESVYYRRVEQEYFGLLAATQEGHSIVDSIAIAFERTKLSAEDQANIVRSSFAHAAELGWFCKSAMESKLP